MYFKDLMNRYKGATIAVLGSGPSLNDHKDSISKNCDVIIACNGALQVMDPEIHKADYFIYGDRIAPQDIWFEDSLKFGGLEEKACKRIAPTFLLHRDPILLPDMQERKILEEDYMKFLCSKENWKNSEVYFRPEIPYDKLNGIVYFGANFNPVLIKKDIGPLCRGATITGTATLLAYKMGATTIELYGCGFNNNGEGGINYAYNPPLGDTGKTNAKQRNKMNRIIKTLQDDEVNVISRGETTLKHLKIIE